MEKKEETSIQGVCGRQIEMLVWACSNNLSLKLDNGNSIDIPAKYSFWRILKDNEIILTVDDLFVKTDDGMFYECLPISDAEYEQFEDILDFDDRNAALFAYLEDVFDKRIESVRHLLEGTTLTSAVEKEHGDFKLCFSTGITLEAFANSRQKDSSYPHLYRLFKKVRSC